MSREISWFRIGLVSARDVIYGVPIMDRELSRSPAMPLTPDKPLSARASVPAENFILLSRISWLSEDFRFRFFTPTQNVFSTLKPSSIEIGEKPLGKRKKFRIRILFIHGEISIRVQAFHLVREIEFYATARLSLLSGIFKTVPQTEINFPAHVLHVNIHSREDLLTHFLFDLYERFVVYLFFYFYFFTSLLSLFAFNLNLFIINKVAKTFFFHVNYIILLK